MSLRMFAIAVAILLIPVGIGAAQDPLLDLFGEAEAIITDVEIFEPPMRKIRNGTSFYAEEQLVEGHTVFATVTLKADLVKEEGNLTIDGFVHCEHHVEAATWNGIPYKINEASAWCRVGERVIVTPDPYGPFSASQPNAPAPPMTPTGTIIPFIAPNAQRAYAEEFVFETEDGRTFYAWATPILEPWTLENGKTKNFLLPMSIARLQHNELSDYRVLFENA